jgi:hypothetical protein
MVQYLPLEQMSTHFIFNAEESNEFLVSDFLLAHQHSF